jgi:hypothetical protein
MVSLLYFSAPDFEFALGGPAEGAGLLEIDEAEPGDLALGETEGLGGGVFAHRGLARLPGIRVCQMGRFAGPR